MVRRFPDRLRVIALSAALACAATPAWAQSGRNATPTAKRLDALQQLVEEQGRQIETLKRQLADQDSRQRETAEKAEAAQQEARKPSPPVRAPGTAEAAAAAAAATAASAAAQAPEAARPVSVGVAPAKEQAAPPMAQIFDEPSILTPRGKFVFEPSFQYSYSSNDRVALVGYTVIPAILIGLIDVREVKRNMMVPTITGRWGISNKMEVEAKLPYVIRSDSTVSREVFTGAAQDNVFDTKGNGIGDVELALRYQMFSARENWPYVVGGLRFKTRTGKDPFEVPTDCVTRCLGNTTGTGLPLEAPTGSGFYSLQPSLTFLYPSDPAVFFGGISYTYNFGRDGVTRTVLNDQIELLGDVKPGDVWGMNFGMGLSINERSSFSIGVELYSIGPTEQNGEKVRGSVRTQLASLLLGYSFRLSDRTNLNVSVGAGLTRDTPDLTLTLRMPMTF
ncbi:acetate kinase [Variovorax dokdonensis]|uniref:Acetate kinase n=1 Tax=Variovorax dokdonensis TaxID=344883 RepID=A0ABT7N8I0_9BURK|nr:acetate kinase [Variovorax dokdonensis]MDM0044200.1 acetate kinase [Variovorax dokdonensis]